MATENLPESLEATVKLMPFTVIDPWGTVT